MLLTQDLDLRSLWISFLPLAHQPQAATNHLVQLIAAQSQDPEAPGQLPSGLVVRSFVSTWQNILKGLEKPSVLERQLLELGQKQAAAGIKESHYLLFGKAFIRTLSHFGNAHWNSTFENQWILLIGRVADLLLEGARRDPHPEYSPPVHRIDPTLEQKVRALGDALVRGASHQELERQLKEAILIARRPEATPERRSTAAPSLQDKDVSHGASSSVTDFSA